MAAHTSRSRYGRHLVPASTSLATTQPNYANKPQGTVFDVSGNSSYAPSGAYHGLLPPHPLSNIPLHRSISVPYSMYTNLPAAVFAGKDASRALATSSVKPEDVKPEWKDLGEKEQGVLADW